MRNGIIAYIDGDKEYWVNDKLHREDGPACEYSYKNVWYYMGQKHRTDGPAIEFFNGDAEYYIHGKLHRVDGPAVEYYSVKVVQWWLNGNPLPVKSQEEFLRHINLLSFI